MIRIAGRLGGFGGGIAAVVLTVGAAGWLVACHSDSLTGTSAAARSPIVSDPASGSALRASGATLASLQGDPDVAFVSLPPGAEPGGGAATVSNVRTGGSTQVPMIDGGFDPVAVPAEAGDTIIIEIAMVGSSTPTVLRVLVPAHRPPVVVRTDPPPRRRDVPLNAHIVVVFSEPIDSTSLAAGAVVRRGNQRVSGTLGFGDAQHVTAVFTPATPLAAGATYTLEVADAIRDLEGDPLPNPVSVDFTTATSTGALSRIAFVEYGSGNAGIYSMNADGSDLRLVAADVGNWGAYDPAWSPDGRRLAFVSSRHRGLGGPDDSDPAVYVMNADGSGITRLTYQGYAQTPAWSPDGAKIAFSTGALFVMNADGSSVTKVGNAAGSDQWREPAWSPDGTRIAFIRAGDNANELDLVNADGSGLRRLTVGHPDAWSPSWSPDGSRIAFVANGDIYVVGADGSGETRLTDLPGQNGSPTWSPDGTMLAFVSSRAATSSYYDGSQIYVMNPDGSGATALTNVPFGAAEPDWSRSGSMPAYNPWALTIEMAPAASGDGQTDTVRATLADPLRVRVLRSGAPAAGVTVTWSVGEGQGAVSSATTTTDAQGIASVSRTLGDTAEGYGPFGRRGRTIARVAGATGSPVAFSASVLPGHPAQLTTFFRDSVGIGAVNTAPGIIRVFALDAYGNPVTGVRIVWRVTAGGGTISPAQCCSMGSTGPDTTANVGNAGSAWAQWTLGPGEGLQVATATAPDIPGAPFVPYRRTAVTALVQVGNDDGDGTYTVDFSPDSVAVPSGRTVGFVWGHIDAGPIPNVHNVTFDDDPTQPTSSSTMGYTDGFEQVPIFTRTFTGGPRTIRYRCTVHGETGVVTIQ